MKVAYSWIALILIFFVFFSSASSASGEIVPALYFPVKIQLSENNNFMFVECEEGTKMESYYGETYVFFRCIAIFDTTPNGTQAKTLYLPNISR